MAISPIVTVPLELKNVADGEVVLVTVSLADSRTLAADLKSFLTAMDRATDKIQKG